MPTETNQDMDKNDAFGSFACALGERTKKNIIRAKIEILTSKRDGIIGDIVRIGSLQNFSVYQEQRIKMAQFFKEEIEYLHILLNRE